MKATKVMPYIVIVTTPEREVLTFGFKTERQAIKFESDIKESKAGKTQRYVSILKAKRGFKS